MTIRWRTLALLVLAPSLSSCSSGSSSCHALCECPAVYLDVVLNVQTAPDAGPLANVGVAFTGAAAGEMTCQSAGVGPGAVCRWPAGPVAAGSYGLQIAAPGYKSADVAATMTLSQPDTSDCCSCPHASLSPSTVTLDSAAAAGSFACGPDGGCSTTEACAFSCFGIISYSCVPLPAACDSTPTCDCLRDAGDGFGLGCQDDGGGVFYLTGGC